MFQKCDVDCYFRGIVRKILIAFLLIGFLNDLEMIQLLKLPALIEHYCEHHQENQHLGFLDFLSEHYNNDHNQSDARHAQLPFKSFQNNGSQSHWIPFEFIYSTMNCAFIVELIHEYSDLSLSVSSAFCRPLIHPPALEM